MRPLRLRVENLTSFRGEQESLELSGLDLFAISGPTGSGKSSLLDALIYSLYGAVPRVGKNHKELISQGRDRMCVMFDFSHGGEAYRVTRRSYRGSQPAQAILDRLSGPGREALAEPVTSGVTAVNDHVERMLGLDYDAFTQAVVLPQGQFARFLQTEPRKRNDMLKELLRLQVYERMRARADAEAKAAEGAARMLEQMLGEAYVDVTPETVAALRASLDARAKDNAALEPKLRRLETAASDLRERRRRVEALDEARRALGQLELRAMEVKEDERRLQEARRAEVVLPRLEAVASAERQARVASEQAAASAARRAEAEAGARRARAAREAAADAAGRTAAIDVELLALARAVALARPLRDASRRVGETAALRERRATELAAATTATTTARERLQAADTAARASLDAEARAQAALGDAEAALQAADLALQEAAVRDVVGHLRHGLSRGDDCPVCERPLAAAPPKVKGAATEKVKKAREQADAALGRARGDVDPARRAAETAARARDRAAAEVEALVARGAAIAAALGEAETAHEAAVAERDRLQAEVAAAGGGADPEQAQARLRDEKQALARALEAATRAESDADAARAAAGAAADAAQAAAAEAEARAADARAAAATALADAGFTSPAAALAARLDRAAQKQLAEMVAAWEREQHAARARVTTLQEELAGLRVDASLLAKLTAQLARADEELAAARRQREEGLQEESRLRQRLGDLEGRLEQAEARRRELEDARAKLSLVRQLALDLRSDRFQAYLLEETFRELVEGASGRLLGLSNRYTLQYDDGGFHVLDHDNAGERRRAETLSGGETFLASLSLALELSQQVQRAAGAVQLESLFIDEGFGTLDTETLNVIADAIESLPTAGRVVGIITHLGELTDRFPVCLKVEKGPEGSRVSLRAA